VYHENTSFQIGESDTFGAVLPSAFRVQGSGVDHAGFRFQVEGSEFRFEGFAQRIEG